MQSKLILTLHITNINNIENLYESIRALRYEQDVTQGPF